MSRLTTSIVVRALNEAEHLPRLIEGLKHQTIQPDEVILVDSGSTDDSVAIAQAAGWKVTHIAKKDFSFGRSLNLGCDFAKGDILVMLSAHVYPVYDTYLEHMIQPFERSQTGITYGRQVGDERTKFSESRVMLKWFPEESIFDQGHPFSNNANAAVRKKLWETYKYDEELTGLEDLEFARRAQADGHRIAYVAEAPVVHVHEETWSIVRNRYRREAIAYARIMGEKHMGAFEALKLGLSNTTSDYFHAIKSREFFKHITAIPAFRIAQFYGAWEGFRTVGNISEELKNRFYYPTDPAKDERPAEPGRKISYTE
jgi:rhamnosyltransferase